MSAKSLAPGVYEVNAGGVSAHLLERDGITVIDTGLPGKVDALLDAVKAIGRDASDIKHILITHYHLDHVGNLKTLTERTGARVYAPAGDAGLLRKGGPVPPVESRGVVGAAISRTVKKSVLVPHEVHEVVSDGDKLSEVSDIQVIGTPGHTPGHVVYLLPESGGVLFVGDSAFNLMRRLTPPPLSEDLEASDKSFVALARRDFEVACMVHGPSITSDASKKWQAAARKVG